MNYIILHSNYTENLAEMVNLQIENGYIPIGTPFIYEVFDGEKVQTYDQIHQTMIKRDLL